MKNDMILVVYKGSWIDEMINTRWVMWRQVKINCICQDLHLGAVTDFHA